MPIRTALLLLGLLTASAAPAADITLATVPPRQSVRLTIYNAEDLTLVQETRTVTLQHGLNTLQFSWANTQIDPTSVTLRFLTPASGLQVLDTRFPNDQQQQLRWQVTSPDDREARVEISYFTAGIRWSAEYRAIIDPATKSLALTNDVQISNHSGEDYSAAHIRLVVGHINLLEKIAELAHMPVSQLSQRLSKTQQNALRYQAAKPLLAAEAAAPAASPPVISHQQLSEYYIYQISGRHNLPDGWSQRLRHIQVAAVPYRSQYRYQPDQYGDSLVRVLRLRNDHQAGLGSTPLPAGNIQILERDHAGQLHYLTSQHLAYTPVGGELSLNLGTDPQVWLEPVTLRVFRDAIWLKLQGADVYRRAGDPSLKVDLPATVAGWDEHTIVEQRIHNGRATPIDVQLRLPLAGDVIFRSQLNAKLYNAHTVALTTPAAAAGITRLRYELIRHQGHNYHQDQIELEQGTPRLTPPAASH